MTTDSKNMERVYLYSTITASVFLLIWSTFSIIMGINSMDIFEISIGVVFLAIGSMTGYYAIRYYRKVIYFEELLDSFFEDGIYKRLDPLVNVISESKVELDEISDNLKMALHKIDKLEIAFENNKQPLMHDRLSDNFTIKSIFLLIISLSIFIYVVENPIFITPYLMPILFFIWWLSITKEFDLFKKEDAWVIGVAPVIVVPILSLFISRLLDFRLMIGVLFLLVGSYAGGYYIWAAYSANGTLPFNIHIELKEAMLELNKKDRD